MKKRNKDDKIMKKVYKRYDKVAEEELWNLDYSLIRWFTPRIIKFFDTTECFIAWTYEEKSDITRLCSLSEVLANDFNCENVKWGDVQHLILNAKNREIPSAECKNQDFYIKDRCLAEWKDLFCEYFDKLWW